MTAVQLIVLGAVIGSNNLATALALGALGQAPRRWRVVLIFGLFEFFVPLLGLWIGRRATEWVVDHASWLSAALLIGLGLVALVQGLRYTPADDKLAERLTSMTGLLLLGAGLSVDNLIVGFSLGLRDSDPLLVATTIAAFSMTFTAIGMTLGSHARRHWEQRAEVLTGILLLAVGAAAAFGWV